MGDISIGAVGAALVAGLVSFLTLVIGKEQKVSEFRQVWIEDLRKCLISYLVNINALSDLIQLEKAGQAQGVALKLSRLQSLNEASHGIALRVNDKEKPAKALLKSMSQFDVIAQDDATLTPPRIREIEKNFINASKKLLKFEWKRVKRGEPTFIWSKRIVFGIVMALSLVYVGLLFDRNNVISTQTTQRTGENLPFFAR